MNHGSARDGRRGTRLLAAAIAAAGLALAAGGCAAAAHDPAASSTPSPSPTLSAAHFRISPKNGAPQAKPHRGITVTVRAGTLTAVTVRSGGGEVAGELDPTSTTWRSRWALPTGKQYVVRATAVDADRRSVTKMSRFRTLTLDTTASIQIFEGHNVTPTHSARPGPPGARSSWSPARAATG